MKYLTKKGISLTELIVAVTIGAVLLVIIFSFVTNTIEVLSETTRKSKIIASLYDVVLKMDNYKNTFSSGSILKNYAPGSGYDVILFKTYKNNAGVVFGIVDPQTFQLDPVANFSTFGKKTIGYRILSSNEVTTLQSTPDTVYTYTFFKENLIPNLIVRDFQADLYNSGTILDIDTTLLLTESTDFIGIPWNQIPQTSLFKTNINF